MSSVNTCPMTRRSGRSPETDCDWVSHYDGVGEKDGDKGAHVKEEV